MKSLKNPTGTGIVVMLAGLILPLTQTSFRHDVQMAGIKLLSHFVEAKDSSPEDSEELMSKEVIIKDLLGQPVVVRKVRFNDRTNTTVFPDGPNFYVSRKLCGYWFSAEIQSHNLLISTNLSKDDGPHLIIIPLPQAKAPASTPNTNRTDVP